MRIVREPMYDEEPRGIAEAFKRRAVHLFASWGHCIVLMAESLLKFPAAFMREEGRLTFFRQLYTVGIKTLPVITVVAIFTGMILGLQVGLELRRFNQEVYVGAAVMVTLIRELGPFVTGVCLSSCVGSAIAAELGTMKVNDEVAALEIMSISPIRYLTAPRITALMVMSPILAFYTCVVGVMGGGLVSYTQLNVQFSQYMTSAMLIAETKDLFTGLFKSLIFGLVIGGVSCHEGFSTDMGAVGVGRAVQRSVIISFLLILTLGYMVTRMFY